jgi:hypothetical protein
VGKYCTAGHATDDNTTHVHCSQGTYAINTLSVYVTCTACPLQQRLHKLALILRYTYIACHLTTQFHLICSSVFADSLLQSIVNTFQHPNDGRTALQ